MLMTFQKQYSLRLDNCVDIMADLGKLMLFSVLTVTAVLGSPDEERLLKDLLKGYNSQSRPNFNLSDPVIVKFGVNLQKIQQVNEKENSITILTWLNMKFTDYRLVWDPSEYGDIDQLHIPYQSLWLPDIVLFNGLSGKQLFEDKINAMVTSEGFVYALPPSLITASCNMDLRLFPYDSQSCPLKFGSWTYDTSKIDLALVTDMMDTSDYYPNSEWELVNSSMALHRKQYACCNDSYADVTATIEIERRAGPYAVKLVIPSVLTSFLILFTFLLPSSSGEKIVFCLLLLLSLILLMIYLHISVPSNSESVLGEFLTFALFLDFFATIIAVVCYNVADALLMRDKLNVSESEKHWATRKRKLKILRITEFVFSLIFLLMYIIGAAVILNRRG